MANDSLQFQLGVTKADLQVAVNHLDDALAMAQTKKLPWANFHLLQSIRKNLKHQVALLRRTILFTQATLHNDEPLPGFSSYLQDSKRPSIKSPSPQDAPPADLY